MDSFSPVSSAFQRKGFHAAGLFWAFYSNAGEAWYEHSHDGTTWAEAATSIGAVYSGSSFSVWFDGTYIHYARYSNADLFYRRGTPVNDGTITWSAVEQTVYDGVVNDNYLYPCIAVDTNGYAWIGAMYDLGDVNTPYVLKNANNDGTWATEFAYQLNVAHEEFWSVAVVPLTSGRVYVIYCTNYELPLGSLYDSGWGAEENDLADFAIYGPSSFDAVALGDNVHLVYTRDLPFPRGIRHNERVWGVGWNVNDVLVHTPSTAYPALSVDPSEGILYCFWTSTDTDHVYYKRYDAGWDAVPTDWINEEVDDIKHDSLINSFYMDYGFYVGLLYVTKLALPYNLKFAFLTTPVPPSPPPPPAEPRPFICCPSCHDASTRVVRIGPVGIPGIKDSRRFFCEACGFYFTSMGETFWEAHGRLRDV